MPDLTNDFVTANNLDMRTAIRRERTIEFFDENFRIDDLKSWKTAEDEMPMNLTGVKWKDTDFERCALRVQDYGLEDQPQLSETHHAYPRLCEG